MNHDTCTTYVFTRDLKNVMVYDHSDTSYKDVKVAFKKCTSCQRSGLIQLNERLESKDNKFNSFNSFVRKCTDSP